MLVSNQVTKTSAGVPRAAVGILLGVLAFGVFAVGFDQGEIFGFTVPGASRGQTGHMSSIMI
jgi:hypothetical protein